MTKNFTLAELTATKTGLPNALPKHLEGNLRALAAMQAAVTTVTAQSANSATGFLGYTSKAAANVYGASLGFARSLIVSSTQWGNIMGYNDNGKVLPSHIPKFIWSYSALRCFN